MSDTKRVVLVGDLQRQTAKRYIDEAPAGYVVKLGPGTRNAGQNERFHAICSDIAKSGLQWAGKPRSAAQWKALLVSGHAKVTQQEFDMVPGLEGEFVNLRESTALMSVRRSASLIDYATAFAIGSGVTLNDPRLAEQMESV